MALDRTSVAIILDPELGWDIRAFAEMMPVQVIDSPTNRPAIESIWNDRRTSRVEREVTVFRSVPGVSAEALLATILRSLLADLGDAADDQRLITVRILGVALTPATERALLPLGLRRCRPAPGGFDATVEPRGADPSARPLEGGS
jgi:hypothetical protein